MPTVMVKVDCFQPMTSHWTFRRSAVAVSLVNCRVTGVPAPGRWSVK